MSIFRLIAACSGLFVGLLVISGLRLRSLTLEGAPLALWLPFVRPLLAAALQMTFVIGAPALGLLARSSGRGLPAVAALSVGLGIACLAPLPALERGKEAGSVAQEILDAALAGCPASPGYRARAPLVGVEWSCPPGAAPIASGRMPIGRDTRFSASAVRLRADLREIELENLRLTARQTQSEGVLRISVQRARVLGLKPWGMPVSAGHSRWLFALGAGLLTLLAGLALLTHLPLRAGWAFVFGAVGGAAAVVVLRSSEEAAALSPALLVPAMAGPAALSVVAGALRLVRKRAPALFIARSAGGW